MTLGQLRRQSARRQEGLGGDDRVVVNGLMRARPGTKVHAEEKGTKPAAPAQAGGPPQQSK